MRSKEEKELFKAGSLLLKAFVAVRSGEIKQGQKLFAAAVANENIDGVMDGVAQALTKIKEGEIEEDPILASDDEEDEDIEDEAPEDEEEEDEEVEEDEEDLEASAEEEEVEAKEELVEIPASVVKFFNIRQK